MSRSSPSLLPWLALAIGVWAAWSWLGQVPGERGPIGTAGSPSSEVGSRVPCAVPLSWHIAQVDVGFALNAVEARRAVEEAAAIWERALGRTDLFPHDERGEVAVRFIFDERQRRGAERLERQDRVEATDARIEARGEALAQSAARLDREIAAHNQDVAEWNRRGGAPPDVVAELRAREEALAAQQRSLDRQIEELNRQVAERNWQSDALARDFPSEVVESGYYAETVRWRFRRIASVTSREIRIFRFDDWDDLVQVIAHELGHALGLDHAPGADAVMSAVHSEVVRELGPMDLALVRERCPELAEG